MTDATAPTSAPSPSEPPRWYRHPRRGYLWPMLLIGLGVFFLLGNLGYLPPLSWRAIGSLWPVLLILIGIEVIVGRREPLLALAIEVVVVIAAVGIIPIVGIITLRVVGNLPPGLRIGRQAKNQDARAKQEHT